MSRWYCDNLRKIVSNNPKRAQLQHKLVHLSDSTSTSSSSPIQLNFCTSLLPVQALYYSNLNNPLPTQLLNYLHYKLNYSSTSSTALQPAQLLSSTDLLPAQLLYYQVNYSSTSSTALQPAQLLSSTPLLPAELLYYQLNCSAIYQLNYSPKVHAASLLPAQALLY